jgi:prolyl-tRNA synthetase
VSQIRHALTIKREDDFAKWYQEVIAAADLAEESGVRGCMVIKPWGYGIWERIQRLMDDRIKAAGVQNCYFPLFIPLANFTREAEHVEGFAKEMAVVTHHRLISDGKGGLIPDPAAKLEEPLVVRPTSETIIGDAMARWVQSWRDLPLLTNQWANVVRWEMRTRMFLRTSEFLWQEGHTAHENREQALAETHRALEMYRACAEDDLALPVIAGEKPENERFPGAVETWSIEAMMQDGKALQAGTSHYLGTNFAHAAGIQYQDREGSQQYCHTTSWGVSTRLIGGVIMTHGDDDGLRVPPAIAPQQIVIIPMLREAPEDAELIAYCEEVRGALAKAHALGERVRVLLDVKPGKAAAKRWDWVRKGAPVIIEVGPRDMAEGKLAVLRRDQLWNTANGKPAFTYPAHSDFVAEAGALLETIQASLYEEARVRRDANITRGVIAWQAVVDHFENGGKYPGWVEVEWSKPTGAALDAVVEKLKAVKLTIRNVPRGSEPATGACIFTGAPAVERILIARAY